MKKCHLTLILSLFISIIISFSGYAQDSLQNKTLHKVYISLYSKLGLLEGVLYKIKDSTILVANSFKKNDYVSGNFELVNFKYKEIENINIKKKGSVIKGILLGTLAGIFVGFTLGNLMGDDPPGLFSYSGTQKGLIFSSLLAIPGAVAGGLIGNIGISILIHGNIDSYKRNKNKMKKYALINR